METGGRHLRIQSTSIWKGVFTPSGALIFAAAQGTPLDYLALEARGTYVPGSQWDYNNWEAILSRRPPPGRCTDSTLKHTSRLPGREAYLLVLEL